ncbi:MAG: asparagine synthase (glutamine-hydrolysing), partial [Parcubacteria group bacterium Gr01-1014_106]
MCGINGFNLRDEALVKLMNERTRHRGPDGTGVFVENGISLGHNRLAIIDLSDAASQPMADQSGRFVIVFNGEIYNYRELKQELEASYQFRTASDTEVILAAYARWGGKCVTRFNGIFAFALWDKETRELILARDHMGVKPLYYYWDGKRFIFSSEIKAILEHDVPRALNREALQHYLRVLYVPAPLTMFAGITKLPPAHTARLKTGKFSVERYWEIPSVSVRTEEWTDTLTEARDVIGAAVRRQLVSDRPLGVYLSGGIDSSIVLAEMATAHKKIDTFSVGFDLTEAEQREKFNADFDLARLTARHFGANHHEVLLASDDVAENFEQMVWHLDEPISNPTNLAMQKIAKFARESVTVVLSGDGGDELFGGYERYRLSCLATSYQRIPLIVRGWPNFISPFRDLNTPRGIERFMRFLFQKDDVVSRVLAADFFDRDRSMQFFERRFFSAKRDISPEEELMRVDQQSWLVDEALERADKMSMAHAIEQRVPLLDKEVVEFAAGIPTNCKVTPFRTKILLKDAYRGHIPDILLRQPKRGWFAPGA